MKKMKMKNKKGIYRECWDFIRESKFYFLIVSLIFFGFILIGFIFPVFFVDEILQFIKELVAKTADMNFWQLLWFIIQNNIMTAFIGMVFGIAFGIFPLLNAVVNGYVLGFVMSRTAEVAGGAILFRLIPHGIFEIPALIISLGLGLKIGMFVFAEEKKKYLKNVLVKSLKVFLFVVVPLLIVAGLIEVGMMFLWG